jgi:hypothetical protein
VLCNSFFFSLMGKKISVYYCFLTHSSFLGCSASDWKVPTTFIYGVQDWMNYQGAQEARKNMNVPCEIIRVPQVFSSPCTLCLIILGIQSIITCSYFSHFSAGNKFFNRPVEHNGSSCYYAGWPLCVHR